jgi:hypothetical protein
MFCRYSVICQNNCLFTFYINGFKITFSKQYVEADFNSSNLIHIRDEAYGCYVDKVSDIYLPTAFRLG